MAYEHSVGHAGRAVDLARRLAVAGAADTMTVAANLAEAGAPATLLDEVIASLGPVDVLVNNAAHAENPDDVMSSTQAGLARTYAVNVFAPAVLTTELARRVGENASAAVINISTDAARAFPGQVGYGTSKAALEAFTRAAAIELGPRGIRVNAIAPGPVQTGWMSGELVVEAIAHTPLRRVGEPADIANAVVFLASDQAQWITGQVIQVAGGHAL